MSTENRNDPKETEASEPFDWEKRLAELEAQGIVSGSRGPRGSLQRFLDQLGQDRRKPDQA
jgi:hypothetical protein